MLAASMLCPMHALMASGRSVHTVPAEQIANMIDARGSTNID
jgi:hypothetical protein